MLILRTDAIGDYILFRNFIKYIKESEKYRHYSITLCGNELWKDLAENYDNEFVDSFIWIDKTKFFRTSGWTYTIRKLNKIHSSGYDVLVDPNEIKSQLSEYIKKHSGAGIIIENSPVFLSNLPEKLEILTRRSNNKPRAPLCEYFQFNANQKFIEELIETEILTKTSIEIEHLTNPEDYIVLFRRFSDLCILCERVAVKDSDLW